MTTKRSPLAAIFFSIFSPGLGFLYIGKPLLAVGLPLAALLILALSSWTRLILIPVYILALMVLAIVTWLGSIVAAGIIAHRQGEVTLLRSQKWYFYIAFIILSWVIGSVLQHNRGQWFGYEPYRIPSQAMAATLLNGDFVMTNTWKYRSNTPKRGEIIVFRFPKESTIYYAKRVIGTSGDHIVIKSGVVYVNGENLEEPYVTSELNQTSSQGTTAFQVPSNAYFVLGDNRDHSNDSRYWGFVPAANITGSVEYIWFSWDTKTGLRADRIGKIVS